MNDGSLALTLLRAVVSLAIVLGLLVLLFRILAAKTGYSPSRRTTPVDVDLLGRRQLTKGAAVCVVRVGERTLVLGVTDAQVSVLTHLASTDLPADGNEDDGPGDTDPSPGLLEAVRQQGRLGRMIAESTTRSGGGRHRRGGSRA